MSKYKTIGVVNPMIKLEAVFYQKGKLTRSSVIALMVIECKDKKDISTIFEPLCWDREFQDILPAMEVGSYLGMEAEGEQKDWKEDMERIDEFDKKESPPIP